MESVKVVLELMPNGKVVAKSSVADLAMIVVVLEKAKIMQNINLKQESSILTPNGIN